jgi:pyruvyltransferase
MNIAFMKFHKFIESKMITIWVQIRDTYLYFFHHALVINAYVDDHTWCGIRHRNWGDDLNYYFIHLISGRPVVFYHNFWLAKKLHLINYLCIGTLLDAVNYSNKETIVWGSGVSGQDRDFELPAKILSVRGEKTREFLYDRNIDCLEVYGDPALLLPRYYKPKICSHRYKLGIIPHVIDLNYDIIQNLKKENFDDILIINLHQYDKWTDIIDQICSCDCIASSSLHGLIVSDAYCVPNCWIELSGKISGGYFKFYDYASSVDRILDVPYHLTTVDEVPLLIEICQEWREVSIDVDKILSVCPFCLKNHNGINIQK